MAKVFAIWHGGSSYSYDPNQIEVFPSMEALKQELQDRFNGWAHIERVDGTTEVVRTPAVDEGSSFQAWRGGDGSSKPETGSFVSFGPRGGVKVDNGVTLNRV
jgi:hypothetical protein